MIKIKIKNKYDFCDSNFVTTMNDLYGGGYYNFLILTIVCDEIAPALNIGFIFDTLDESLSIKIRINDFSLWFTKESIFNNDYIVELQNNCNDFNNIKGKQLIIFDKLLKVFVERFS